MGVGGRGFRKNKKDWLNLELFSVCRGEPVLPKRRSAPRTWLRTKTKTEMLKRVQTRRAGYRLQGMRSREEKRQSIQGFNATEEVVRAAVCGSPSHCHPELVSGSGSKNEQPGRVASERRTALFGDGFLLNEGPRTVFHSVQRLSELGC